MKIAIGSDHAGYPMRRALIDHLEARGIETEDFGACNACDAYSYVAAGCSVAEAVKNRKADFGIVVCGTGLGISMTANKIPGIRAALCTNEYMARMARAHNDANILALGARVIGERLALSIADAFLEAAFEGGRHQERLNELSDLEVKKDV